MSIGENNGFVATLKFPDCNIGRVTPCYHLKQYKSIQKCELSTIILKKDIHGQKMITLNDYVLRHISINVVNI